MLYYQYLCVVFLCREEEKSSLVISLRTSSNGAVSSQGCLLEYVYEEKFMRIQVILNLYSSACACIQAVERNEQRYRSTIWGPTCDSADKIMENFWIPALHTGDWLLIYKMGAYSVSLCTDFNGCERAQIYPIVTPDTLQALNPPTATFCNDQVTVLSELANMI